MPSNQRRVWDTNNVNYGPAASATAAVGRAIDGAADRAMDVSDKAFRLQQEEKNKDARLLASQRENQAQRDYIDLTFGKDGQEGLFSKKGDKAFGLDASYEEQSKIIRDRALDGIADPLAREILQQSLDNMHTSNYGKIKSHIASERQNFAIDQATNRAALAGEKAGLDYINEDTFNQALIEAETSALAVGNLAGAPQEAKAQAILKARSTVYRSRLTSMINSDDPAVVQQAYKLYEKGLSQGDIQFSDATDMDAAFDAIMPKVNAHMEFSKYKSSGSLKDELSGDIFKSILQVESGGRHTDKTGKIITSHAGAKGIAQLMPATAKEMAKELGLPEDAINDPALNAQIGEAYLNKMINYFGDNTLAVLSYNWGPGNVKKHIEEVGDPRKGEVDMDYFLATVPSKEARQYVPKVMAKMGLSGGGKLDEGRATQYANNLEDPQSRDEFLKLVKQNNEATDAAQKQATASAMDSVFEFMTSTGTGWQSLPNSLRVQASNAGIMDQVRDYDGTTQPETAAMLYAMDAKTFKEFDLNTPSVRFALSPADYEKFKAKQTKLDSAAMLASDQARKNMVDQAFIRRGISYTKDADKLKVLRVNDLLDAEIDAFVENNGGRSPNDADIQKMVDTIFIKGKYDQNGIGGIFDFKRYGGGQDYMFDITYEDIPEDDRDAIENDLRNVGAAITQANVIKAFLAKQTKQGGGFIGKANAAEQ